MAAPLASLSLPNQVGDDGMMTCTMRGVRVQIMMEPSATASKTQPLAIRSSSEAPGGEDGVAASCESRPQQVDLWV